MSDQATNTPLPYRVSSEYRLRATGRWRDGGILEITDPNGRVITVDVPAPEFSLVALLIQAGQRSTDEWAYAFRTRQALLRDLKRHGVVVGGLHQPLSRTVFNLRQRFNKLVLLGMESVEGDRLGKAWIEHHRRLGYRVSLPPENLSLVFLED